MLINAVVICGSDERTILDCLYALANQSVLINLTIINNAVLQGDSTFKKIQEVAGKFNEYKIINNEHSLGFSANNNRAIRMLPFGAEFVMLINDDTIMRPGALVRMISTIRTQEKLAVVSPQLLNIDGTPQPTAIYVPRGIQEVAHALIWDQFTLRDITGERTDYWFRGVCLLIRSKALQEVGTLDEGFDPGYSEDLDLCYRFIRNGWRLGLCEDACVVHLDGKSFGQRSPLRYKLSFRGILRFMAKWYPLWQQIIYKLAWGIGMSIRTMISFIYNMLGKSSRLPSPEVYITVLREILSSNK
jgi:GT2 family glycosyltransferase